MAAFASFSLSELDKAISFSILSMILLSASFMFFPFLEFNDDRFVVDVANAPAAIGKDGIELLERAPGVWVDDEKISINGKSGSKVYVNDRELRMEPAQLLTYLRSLRADDIQKIAGKMLEGLKGQLRDMDIAVEFPPAAVEAVANAGFDPVYGARPLRRAIRSKMEDPISEEMLEGNMKAGGSYVCDFKDGKYVIEDKAKKSGDEKSSESEAK